VSVKAAKVGDVSALVETLEPRLYVTDLVLKELSRQVRQINRAKNIVYFYLFRP
jgi:hypothetical protein